MPVSRPQRTPRHRVALRDAKRRPTRAPKRQDLLATTLASGALASLITYFATHPDEAPHLRALQRRTGLPFRSLQTELRRLERLGVLIRRPEGMRVHYALDERSPRWRALRALVRELADPVDVLRDAISDVTGLDAAFVFGSEARGDVHLDSDIDVFILASGDLSEDELSRRTLDAGVLLGREINVVAMSRDDLASRVSEGSGFLRGMLDNPKRWIVGDPSALRGLPGTGARK